MRAARVLIAALPLLAAPAFANPASSLASSVTTAAPKRRAPQAKAAPKAAPAPEEKAAAAPAGAPTGDVAVGPRGPTRIDFDDRLIQGQANKSGAVYLFDRKDLAIWSMVRQRTSFRDQIVKDILTE